MQNDGNFVLYTADKPVWHTDTKGKKDVRLVLQDDRNLVLYAADGSHGRPRPRPTLRRRPSREAARAGSRGRAVPVEEAAAPSPSPPQPRADLHVESGDTLWAIAERFYGDGSKYQVIADASGIANPDLIHPGQVLTIP